MSHFADQCRADLGRTVTDEAGDAVRIHPESFRDQMLELAERVADDSSRRRHAVAIVTAEPSTPLTAVDVFDVLVDAVTELRAFDRNPDRVVAALGIPVTEEARVYVRTRLEADVDAALVCLCGGSADGAA